MIDPRHPTPRRTSTRLFAALLACATAFTAAPALAKTKPAAAKTEPARARNVILFLGDAGGLSTLNAAGILAHDKPQSLFIQSMPHIALSDTSSADRWVSDSAAGMTAIMTGQKTGNGVVSMAPGADGLPLKTLLEHAEERGLATGVVTNMKIWDATPAACYAHVPSRKGKDDIFRQMLSPRFGDGVDILLGKGRADAMASFAARGTTAEQAIAAAGGLLFNVWVLLLLYPFALGIMGRWSKRPYLLFVLLVVALAAIVLAYVALLAVLPPGSVPPFRLGRWSGVGAIISPASWRF